MSWYLLLVILNKILLIKKYQRYHFDIHICNVLNCYNSRKLPKVSNVEDTQHEQKFISNKYDYNYIMITYHHMVNYHQEFLQYQYCMYLYKTNVLMGILYTISYKLMYLFFIVSITTYIVHHSNSTGLLNYLIYSSIILPMIGRYAPSKLLLKLCMYFILIITCNLISHIMIISNCFILIVISVKLPLCIMCTHLYTITQLIIIITSVCIIILHGSIFALSLLHIFYNLPLNYYQQLIVIALLLNLNNILFYTFLRLKMLKRFNIQYLSCKYPIIDVLFYYYIFNSYIQTLTHLNVILHRLTHLERNLDLNPLTTNKYRCINQINQSIMVYPVSLQNDSEMLDMFPNDIIENDTIQGTNRR